MGPSVKEHPVYRDIYIVQLTIYSYIRETKYNRARAIIIDIMSIDKIMSTKDGRKTIVII